MTNNTIHETDSRKPRRVLLIFSLLSILLVLTNTPGAHAQSLTVSTDRYIYNVGEPVGISFTIPYLVTIPTLTVSVTLYVDTPLGSVSRSMGMYDQSTHYVAMSGVTTVAGTYLLRIRAVWVPPSGPSFERTGSTSFVVQGAPFDFTMAVSPTAQSVIQGDTATFEFTYTFSSAYFSGTTIYVEVSGLASGMRREVVNVREGLAQLLIYTLETTPLGTYSLTLTGTGRGVTRQVSFTLTVVPKFDFSVSCSPSSQTVNIGDKSSFAVTVNLVSGTAAPVSLTIQGLPADVTSSYSPQTGTPPFTSTLTVDAAPTASEGTYSITITASSGSTTRTTSATLTVRKWDFTLSASPQSLSVKQVEKGTFDLTIQSIGGFDQLVNLQVTGLPNGVTYMISVPSGKPLFTSRVTLDVSGSAAVGSYALMIEATGGGRSHSLPIQLTVEKGDFLQMLLSGPNALILVLAAVVAILGGVLILRLRGKRATTASPPKTPSPAAPQVICKKCGASNPSDVSFCMNCGEHLK